MTNDVYNQIVEIFSWIVMIVFAFLFGRSQGREDEQRRIQEAFESEDYKYGEFFDVLNKYEDEKEAFEHRWKMERKRKQRKRQNKVSAKFNKTAVVLGIILIVVILYCMYLAIDTK